VLGGVSPEPVASPLPPVRPPLRLRRRRSDIDQRIRNRVPSLLSAWREGAADL